MAKETKGSLNPDTYVEGGGLVQNVNTKWTELAVQKGYKDNTFPNATVLKISMVLEDGEEHEEYYSAGSKCEPNEEGTGVEGEITRDTKVGKLVESLIGAGFPKDKIGNDVSVFVGLECFMIRQVVPERKGLPKKTRPDGKVYDETILLVDKITKMPWEKGKKVSKVRTGETTESSNDVEEKAQQAVLAVLTENPKGIDKKALTKALFSNLKDDPDRTAIIQLTYKESFLSEGPWTYEKGKLTV